VINVANSKKQLNKPSDFILYLLFVAIAFIVYSPVFWGWYSADDFWHIDSFSFPFTKCLENILTGHVYLQHPDWHYRPVTNMFLMLIYKSHIPIVGHILSVALHSAVAIALFNLAKKIFDQRQSAILAALIFLLHPAAAPTVSWIAAVGDILTTGFSVCVALCFISSKRTAFKTVLMVVLFIMALLSKEMCATLPILLAILSLYKKNFRKDRVHLLLLLAILAVFIVLRMCFVENPFIPSSSPANSFVRFSFQTLLFMGRYFSQLIIQIPIHRIIMNPFSLIAIMPLTLIVTQWILSRKQKKSIRFFPVALGIMLLALLPVINAFAPWYQYFPAAIFSLLAGYIFMEKFTKRYLLLTVLWLAILGTNTFFVARESKSCSIYEKKIIASIAKIPEDTLFFGNAPCWTCENALLCGNESQFVAALSQFYGQKKKRITILAPVVVDKIWEHPAIHSQFGTIITCHAPAGKANYYAPIQLAGLDTSTALVTFSNFTGVFHRPKTDQIRFKKPTNIYDVSDE